MSKLNRDETRYAAKRIAEGAEYADVAKKLGRHENNVRGQVQRKSVDRTLEALDMLDDGLTLAEVGEKMGLSKQRVNQIVGNEPDVGSRGRKVVVDASEETWFGVLDLLDRVDIRVKGGAEKVDTRAVTKMMDLLVEGRLELKRVRRRRSR